VLTGAGRGFCSGADMNTLQGIQSGGASTGQKAAEEGPFDPSADPSFQKAYSYFPAVKKPIIAAINGAAAGLGLIMTLYCDMRFASDAAVFTTAFARRGLIAEHGISWMLPRLIGPMNAADLLLSGRTVDAMEAAAMGLVRVLPLEGFAAAVHAYASELATLSSPRSARIIKQQLQDAPFVSLAQATRFADAEQPQCFETDDFREGVASFTEKRVPHFTGH